LNKAQHFETLSKSAPVILWTVQQCFTYCLDCHRLALQVTFSVFTLWSVAEQKASIYYTCSLIAQSSKFASQPDWPKTRLMGSFFCQNDCKI